MPGLSHLQNCVHCAMRRKRVILTLFFIALLQELVGTGSILAIHTSEFTNISVQHWLKQLLSRNIQSDSDSMNFLQDVFVILWTIWTYRNRVVHQGLNLNPVEVILTTQTFSYRYRDTLSRCSTSADREGRCARLEGQSAAGDWHLIIKLAGARSRRPYRYGTAY